MLERRRLLDRAPAVAMWMRVARASRPCTVVFGETTLPGAEVTSQLGSALPPAARQAERTGTLSKKWPNSIDGRDARPTLGTRHAVAGAFFKKNASVANSGNEFYRRQVSARELPCLRWLRWH